MLHVSCFMSQSYDNYIISAINELSENQGDFGKLKKSLCKKFGVAMPTNADLRDRYNKLVEQKKIKRSEKFEEALMSRLIRTQSGVAVVAVLTKSYPCPGKCIYCPSEKDMPKSYLSNEPAVMRAIDSQFDPYRQVQNRLRSLELNGHRTDKIELIVMGGTFSFLPKAYQKKFIYGCFKAANDYPRCHPEFISGSRSAKQLGEMLKQVQHDKLLREQKRNEKAKHRIIGLTLETRPDYIDEKEILNFRQLGCTRVELGVQSLYDDVLELNKRGHLIQSTIDATKMLKDSGFKINYHMMPGLPGSTPKRDFEMFKALFEGPRFQPDMLKIYPTVVLKNSELYDIWKKKKYVPLTNQAFERLVVKIKNEAITPYVRIARLIRDVPTPSIVAGPTVSNLRQIIIPKSNCPCIRCREVGAGYIVKEKIVLDRIDYAASDGKEIFLQYVSPDKKKLFALLRLRIPSSTCHAELVSGSSKVNMPNEMLKQVQHDKLHDMLPVLKNAAIIREVHTYGKLTKIDTLDSTSPQHIGLGKKLLLEAERIAKEEYDLKKIVVISGVGVRGYYRKQGYKLSQTYLVKKI
ncbi:MAG TPA: tRNA uridine(34) 5-carboxymethylaminomethyl modification radical SAM/GNAT enzyme Elp3 [Candidatus Moranbacteria bacterium]|nr:tRNA uridine(34) 5-carboxymethylaminomethyl modification radical SAM/GNAT enzyme Elp3 [Candidatus Moranbacteria bacterium]HBT45555.1 tRNA uridine(34) 5-carboxymethylaminomethyl modification radical SAM/GNAT enzyme Elp3 [Candidatus Moranbacteria bacterium]